MVIENLNPEESASGGLEVSPLPQEETPVSVERSVKEVKSIIEALLFATDQPLPIRRLMETIGVEKGKVLEALEQLKQEYQSAERSFQIEEIAGGFQLLSKPEYHEWILKLEKKNVEGKLSPAALETLAVIAYKQPILRSTIDAIRGVESSQTLRGLIEKGLVKIVGRDETLGRPLLYGTTKRFLEYFGLRSLQDLPRTQELPS
ncbi:MAG TPA: SMC-Scp complex subunit ScpB [Candidatus Hypogeohydataceae bacterium YC38]